jgi:hypothetical protein
MAKSGRGVSVRLVGKGATVVERPMTDQERLEAAFAAFEPHVKLADRMRGAGPMRMAASEAAT